MDYIKGRVSGGDYVKGWVSGVDYIFDLKGNKGKGALLCMICLPHQPEVYGYVVSRRIIVISYLMQKQGCLYTFNFGPYI